MRNFAKFIISFCLIFILFIGYIPSFAFADSDVTTVLDDLRKDETFNIDDYPALSTNDLEDPAYCSVIQIAETSNGHLCIYVYQPADQELDFIVRKISIATGFETSQDNLDFQIYDLELLSTEGVFDKYLVKNFNIPKTNPRYYNIVCLYREFIEGVDSLPPGSVDLKISIPVGQQWFAYTYRDIITYEMNTFETIEVKPTYSGYLLLHKGIQLSYLIGIEQQVQSWFLSVNIPNVDIEKITNVKMSYTREDVTLRNNALYSLDYSWGLQYGVLSELDTVVPEGSGLFGYRGSWKRILRGSDFVTDLENQKINFDSSCRDTIYNSSFVFSFLETSYNSRQVTTVSGHKNEVNCSRLSEITVIQLSYMDTSQKVYENIGVVSDSITPDLKVDGGTFVDKDFGCNDFNSIITLILTITTLLFFVKIIRKKL